MDDFKDNITEAEMVVEKVIKKEGQIYAYITVVTLFLLGFCYLNLLIGLSNIKEPINIENTIKPVTVAKTESNVTNQYIHKQDVQKFLETVKVV